ncbi:MAG: tRNA uridine-5-carboxymethylaminomethyl(34) synthesis GTPase MnmE [Bacillota bacterium]|nr:tRNA uridine-5-carboxymethylaminomethyl(34) synthesis GTPase MnmE [Bacillota bacterium]
MRSDNIVALSTPSGEAGIGVIRLSGETVIQEIDRVFLPFKEGALLQEKSGYTLNLGWILDEKGYRIDQVLVGVMKEPRSYTGENVIEINCHGGSMPVRRCLERCLELGIRMAEPGEFTKRAFLNGRLDLSQAEAVIDVIRAKTDRGLKLAMEQLEGVNSRYIVEIEEDLLRVNAMVEASIDFPDDVGDLDNEEARALLQGVIETMDRFLEAGKRGQIYRDGASIAICGKPNVGKSSLLNVLVRKEKAIVTEIPGTTRDVIEEYINIKGIPVKVMDTAGIHVTEDFVEKLGIERSLSAIEKADVVLFLLDMGSGLTEEDLQIINKIDKKHLMILVNKEDLEEKKIDEGEIENRFPGIRVIRGSVKEETGIEDLENALKQFFLQGVSGQDELEIMMNIRHQKALVKSRQHVKAVIDVLEVVTLDCLAVDLQESLVYLGEITGKTLKEEAIERIFHDFCIGK